MILTNTITHLIILHLSVNILHYWQSVMAKMLGIDKTLLTYVTLNILILTGEMLMDIGVQLLIIKSSYKGCEENIINMETMKIKSQNDVNITRENPSKFENVSLGYLHAQVRTNNNDEMSNITKEYVITRNNAEQHGLAATYLLYNRIILEAFAFLLLPLYTMVLGKYGPKLPITLDCGFLIFAGIGYIMCTINIHKCVLDYVLLSTLLRSCSAMHGAFYIAASTAISYGYSGKDLSERHHWLFSARFTGSILGYFGQGTLEMFVGIQYVFLMSICLFVLAIIIVCPFLSNTHSHVKEKVHDDVRNNDAPEQKGDIESGDDKRDLKLNGTEIKDHEKSLNEKSHLIPQSSCNEQSQGHSISNRIKQSIKNFGLSFSETFKNPAINMSRKVYIISIVTILSVQLFDRMIKMARKDTVFLYLMMSSWEESQVSFLLATEAMCSVFILTFGVPFFTRVLALGDFATCTLVLFLRTVSFEWYSLRTSMLEVYISTLLLMSPICLLLSALRSALSKLVPHENLIKIFSMLQLMDATANILGTTLSLEFYKFTLDTFPGALFQVTAALSFLMACAMGAVGCALPRIQTKE